MILLGVALSLLVIGLIRGLEISVWLILIASSLLYAGHLLGLIDKDPMAIILISIKNSFHNIALIIMMLFGYSHYMQRIGANQALITLVSRPLMKLRQPYILLIALFLLASLLSLVITSAAALAILLLSTFYPILKKVGISKPAIAAVIVSATGILPSPLAVETHLSAQALNLSINDYIALSYTITLPMLFAMAITHGIWQYRQDKALQKLDLQEKNFQTEESITPIQWFLAPLPFLPLILFTFYALVVKEQEVDIMAMLFMALGIAWIVDLFLNRSLKIATQHLAHIWQGMATGLIQVGSIVISAGLFVQAIKELGIIEQMLQLMQAQQLPAIALIFLLMMSIIFVALISGSGLALYFGLAPFVPLFADISGVEGWKLATLLEVTAHTSRTFSILAAVMIVTSKQLDISLRAIMHRTYPAVLMAWGILILHLFLHS
ncbi:C4-dicarboxylate transporter DcuC [Spirochaetales bacterium BR151]|uniref:C4-dicarboxylate transporter DcuC n=2 Tax=Entomospira culicis TaxID=2719989 RepID=A0A968KVP9_9SPIO|nr:C4-dicarboxylate transporter DcuC [Entomospira culicis]NIZ69368.1 C4-dicarboxylate transporter DcuC [Entomospira culicis]